MDVLTWTPTTSKEPDVQYWYNIETGKVETDETRSRNDEVMGPYASEDEAASALESARAKTEKWDEEDREWEERGSGSDGGSW